MMQRKTAFAFVGAFLGVFSVWVLIKLASAGYAFGRFLAGSGAGG